MSETDLYEDLTNTALTRQEGESVEDWFARIQFTDCSCGISAERLVRRHVNPRGPLDSSIVLVGEAPGAAEEEFGEAFVGPAGKKLDEALSNAGVDSRSLYITNTVKCRPLSNRAPISEECKICRGKFLKHEITAYPRKLIVAVGNIGYYGVVPKGTPSGIMSRTGIFEENEEFGCYVLPCIHPAAVLRNPSSQSLLDDVANKIAEFINNGYQTQSQHSVVYKEIRDLETFREFLREVRECGRFSCDLESGGFDYLTDKIFCISFSTVPYTAWYLPLIEEGEGVWTKWDWSEVQEGLRGIFEDSTIGKIGHNLKFDLKFLITHFRWDIKGRLDDTMLMHHLLDENTRHGLKELSSRYTDLGNYASELEASFKQIKRSRVPLEEKHFGKVPLEVLKKYAQTDADATYRLYEIFMGMLKEQDLYYTYRFIVMDVMPVLMKMELIGVRIDKSSIKTLGAELEQQIGSLAEKINSYSVEEINIHSPAQLGNLLYDVLGLPVLKKTDKGGLSTDEETLKLLQEKTQHPILEDLLEFRKLSKLYTTYATGLEELIAADGRLHTSYLQHATVTGRLASSSPNLQNVPRGSTIRNLFVPTEGWLLIVADFKQSELRSWANYSQDQKFKEALLSSDVHSVIGAELLNKSIDQITKEERSHVKMAVFGVAYGRSAGSLAAEWKMTWQEAQEFIDRFFQLYSVSAQWLLDQEQFAKEHKYVKSLFGRVRRLPEVDSTNEGVKASALRMARNSSIQSLSSDVTNLSLVRIDKAFRELGMKSRLLLQIHDSVVIESPTDEVKDAVRILEECMTTQPHVDFIVPLAVDIEVSDRWGGEKIDLNKLP